MPKKSKYNIESDNNDSNYEDDSDEDIDEENNNTEIYDNEEIENEEDEVNDKVENEDENNNSDDENINSNNNGEFILMETSDNNIISKENRISLNRLTKYEMVRILGERTKQLSMGAKPLIKNYNGLAYDKIAIEELKISMIPFKIKRPLPNGFYEIWTLDELKYDHLLSILE
jgi:DNA-directed RNA polymerase I, II, and III subunit RPABC2